LLFFLLLLGACGYRLPLSVTDLISVILVLQKNTALQVLDLKRNQIGDAGAAALADGIKVSPV
jgi:hypothetical protein